jgi:transcriptional regulator with XRE-family HTH domain
MAEARRDLYEKIIKPKLHLIEDWARNGINQDDIAKKLGINRCTLMKYKKEKSDVFDALKNKEEADGVVENALLKMATGFYAEDTITEYDGNGVMISKKVHRKYYQPNHTAALAWLNNRRPDRWKQRQEIAVSQEGVAELQELITSVKNAVPVVADIVDLQ